MMVMTEKTHAWANACDNLPEPRCLTRIATFSVTMFLHEFDSLRGVMKKKNVSLPFLGEFLYLLPCVVTFRITL
jgi:hypothetical protein